MIKGVAPTEFFPCSLPKNKTVQKLKNIKFEL